MQETQRFYLECIYDTRQSFYGKAVVVIQEDNICKNYLLYSYDTLVAIYTITTNGIRQYDYLGKFSQTTTRHQKEFFKQYGLSDKEIKGLMNKKALKGYIVKGF